MNCRFCESPLTLPFIDLVNAPPSNSFLTKEQLDQPEAFFPLQVFVCESCWLVQIAEYKKHDEIFSPDYVYFSSFSSSWLEHCKTYVHTMTERLGLDAGSFVMEIASNDGYLLQYFRELGIPALGIEPTHGTAGAARERGVETLELFWGAETARSVTAERGSCDLILGNNVLAHVPDIDDFVEGFRIALKPAGTLTFEFPHLKNLIEFNQFDTIYHEHYSYLSLFTVRGILAEHGLVVYDVQELPTHGGSLRVFARHADHARLEVLPAVSALIECEVQAGLQEASGYRGLQKAAEGIRSAVLEFLVRQKRAGKRVAAYGAAAKGNTLLNYCGIKGTEFICYVVDASRYKQGLFLPGSHIPVVAEERIRETRPDFVIILPWNIRAEIERKLDYIRDWGGKFVTFVPDLRISEDA